MTASTPQPPAAHDTRETTSFVRHAWVFGALTLLSRVSGLVRDMVFSRVMGTTGIMSAWTTAFIVPNIFRRLFGEGALGAAFIPEYARLAERDPRVADQLASLTIAALAVLLGVITLALELALLALYHLTPLAATGGDVLSLAMIMLPYMPLVCITAILGGMLQTHGRFAPSAAAPVILNICMIGAATVWGLAIGADLRPIAASISVSVVIAGFLQVAWNLWALRGHVRWTRAWAGARGSASRMLRSMVPVVVGMGAFQLGTLVDGLLAGWPKIFGRDLPYTAAPYPLDESAASVLYYAQRLYQFPLGVFGIAIATAVFPALARFSEDNPRYADTLRKGLKLSLFIGLPASVGLLLVREEVTSVIYAGGRFGDEQVRRVAFVLLAYTFGIWAYSLTQLLTRAFYAQREMTIPMRVGVATVGVNIVLSVALLVPLREAGLALATSISAIAQCLALVALAARRLMRGEERLLTPRVRGSVLWTVSLTAIMGAAVYLVGLAPWPEDAPMPWRIAKLATMCAVGGGVFLLPAAAARRDELTWLLGRFLPGRDPEGR